MNVRSLHNTPRAGLPANALENSVLRYSSTEPGGIAGSTVIIDAAGNITTPGTITSAGIIIGGLALDDGESLSFGDDLDMSMQFTGSNFNMTNSNATSNINIVMAESAGATAIRVTNPLGLAASINSAGEATLGKTTITGSDAALSLVDGALSLASLTTVQRDALTPVPGMILWNSSSEQLEVYGSSWVAINSSGAAGSVTGQVQLRGSDGLLDVSDLGFTSSRLDISNASGVYAIDGTDVLSSTTLGSSVLASSLTSVGTLSSLAVSGDIDAGPLQTSAGSITLGDTATLAIVGSVITLADTGKVVVPDGSGMSSPGDLEMQINSGAGSGSFTVTDNVSTLFTVSNSGVSANSVSVVSLSATSSITAASSQDFINLSSGQITCPGPLQISATNLRTPNLGIGTVPDSPLHVTGSIAATPTVGTHMGTGTLEHVLASDTPATTSWGYTGNLDASRVQLSDEWVFATSATRARITETELQIPALSVIDGPSVGDNLIGLATAGVGTNVFINADASGGGAAGYAFTDPTTTLWVCASGGSLEISSGATFGGSTTFCTIGTNIDTTGVFSISGTTVISSNALGSGVTSSSLTSLGTLTGLDVSGSSFLATTQITELGVGAAADSNTILNVSSSSKTVRLPDLSNVSQTALTAGMGMIHYNSDTNALTSFNGTDWVHHNPDGASGTLQMTDGAGFSASPVTISGTTLSISGTPVISDTALLVTASSLTSVGTLTSLNVTGNVDIATGSLTMSGAQISGSNLIIGADAIVEATAGIDIAGTTTALRVSRQTTAQLSFGSAGMIAYDTDKTSLVAYTTSWQRMLPEGAAGAIQVAGAAGFTDSGATYSAGILDIESSYRIGGTQVLNATGLGSGVVSSSLTSVGTLVDLDVTGAVTAGANLTVSGQLGVGAAPSHDIDVIGTSRWSVDVSGVTTIVGRLDGTGALIVSSVGALNLDGTSLHLLVASTEVLEVNSTQIDIALDSVALASGNMTNAILRMGATNTLGFDSACIRHEGAEPLRIVSSSTTSLSVGGTTTWTSSSSEMVVGTGLSVTGVAATPSVDGVYIGLSSGAPNIDLYAGSADPALNFVGSTTMSMVYDQSNTNLLWQHDATPVMQLASDGTLSVASLDTLSNDSVNAVIMRSGTNIDRVLRCRASGSTPQGECGVMFSRFDNNHWLMHCSDGGDFNLRYITEVQTVAPSASDMAVVLDVDKTGNLNVAGSYEIGGTTVLSSTILASGVTDSSLQNLGVQNASLDMGGFHIQNTGNVTAENMMIGATDPSLLISGTYAVPGSPSVVRFIDISGTLNGTGTVGNAYGIYVTAPVAGTATITNAWAIRATDSSKFNTLVASTMAVGADVVGSDAVLDLVSTSRGLLVPRMVGTAVNALSTAGLIAYDTTSGRFRLRDATGWQTVNITSTSGTANAILVDDGAGGLISSGATYSTHLNIESGGEYRINGSSVLSSTILGSTVVASSLTSVGTLTSLVVSGNLTAGSTLYVSGGNVGVGAAPSYDFDVTGTSRWNIDVSASETNVGRLTGSGNLRLKSVGNLALEATTTWSAVAGGVSVISATSSQVDINLNGTALSTGNVATHALLAIGTSEFLGFDSSCIRHEGTENLSLVSDNNIVLAPSSSSVVTVSSVGVGIGAAPESSLMVVGNIDSTPTVAGVHVGMSSSKPTLTLYSASNDCQILFKDDETFGLVFDRSQTTMLWQWNGTTISSLDETGRFTCSELTPLTDVTGLNYIQIAGTTNKDRFLRFRNTGSSATRGVSGVIMSDTDNVNWMMHAEVAGTRLLWKYDSSIPNVDTSTIVVACDNLGNFDVLASYEIGSTIVLSATTLGSGVVNSSLTSLGVQAAALDMGSQDIDAVDNLTAQTAVLGIGSPSRTIQPIVDIHGTVTTVVSGNFYATWFDAPTITAGVATTHAIAATVYIEGAPVSSGSASITDSYALYVDAGDVLIDTALTSKSYQMSDVTSFNIRGNVGGTVYLESLGTQNDRLYVQSVGGMSFNIDSAGSAAGKALVFRSNDTSMAQMNQSGRWQLYNTDVASSSTTISNMGWRIGTSSIGLGISINQIHCTDSLSIACTDSIDDNVSVRLGGAKMLMVEHDRILMGSDQNDGNDVDLLAVVQAQNGLTASIFCSEAESSGTTAKDRIAGIGMWYEGNVNMCAIGSSAGTTRTAKLGYSRDRSTVYVGDSLIVGYGTVASNSQRINAVVTRQQRLVLHQESYATVNTILSSSGSNQASIGIYVDGTPWKPFNIGAAAPAGGLTNPVLQFCYGITPIGYLQADTNITNISFTGQHRCQFGCMVPADCSGLIVIASDRIINLNGSTRPTINEALPVVMLAQKARDKRVYGVISGNEDFVDGNRSHETGMLTSFIKAFGNNDQRAFVNSLGEGGIWVVNTNGPIESGDFIESSDVPGYGQKSDDILHNYTVAKACSGCSFSLELTPRMLPATSVHTERRSRVAHDTGRRIEKVKETNWNSVLQRYEEIIVERWRDYDEPRSREYDVYQQGTDIVLRKKNVDQMEEYDYKYIQLERDDHGMPRFVPELNNDGSPILDYEFDTRWLRPDGTMLTRAQYDSALASGETVYVAQFIASTYHCG
jgi:hypothetical protein